VGLEALGPGAGERIKKGDPVKVPMSIDPREAAPLSCVKGAKTLI
jgi:hypothetical protein